MSKVAVTKINGYEVIEDWRETFRSILWTYPALDLTLNLMISR